MTTTEKEKPQARPSEATKTLLFIAARFHSLRDCMGLRLEQLEGKPVRLHFTPGVHRPWLVPHPLRPEELSFDPDIFSKNLDVCSDGERHIRIFIMNVWNPEYAKEKGWTFDLFKALRVLDSNHCEAMAWFLERPTWP